MMSYVDLRIHKNASKVKEGANVGNKDNKRQKKYDRADALYKQLMGKYEVLRQYKTLEIGVKDVLIQAIHNNPLFAENSVYIINLALKRYTHSLSYLKNAIKYGKRYNLQNEQVGKLTERDLTYFKKELKKRRS